MQCYIEHRHETLVTNAELEISRVIMRSVKRLLIIMKLCSDELDWGGGGGGGRGFNN